MGRSSNKKVARAAGIGGGRTSKGRPQMAWYAALTMLFLAGFVLVFLSTKDRRTELAGSKRPPAANRDHWHAAYAFYVCDRFEPAIANDRDLAGIHTHKLQSGTTGDGLIHIHPFNPSTAGKNATFQKFAESAEFELTDSQLKLPGEKKAHKNGDKCGKKRGRVQAQVDGKLWKGDPRKIPLKDRQKITIAFVPVGAKIPPPPGADQALANITDLSPPSGGTGGPGVVTLPGGTPPPPGGTP